MSRRFVFWAFILIASLVVSGLCFRFFAVWGVSSADALVVRGVWSLVCVAIFARLKRLSLRPRSPGTQFIRAMIAGLALTFFGLSYEWLSASSVSVLSNIDIPFLLILGPLVGVKTSQKTQGLAALSILFLIIYVTAMQINQQTLLGLGSLTLGTVLLCFGYFFIKKSMSDENEAITVLTPSLAIIVFGLAEGALGSGFQFQFNPLTMFAAALSGASMFGAYYATMRLYEVTDIANAEFPTLLSAVVIQPLEALVLREPMQASYFFSSIAFVITMHFLLKWRSREEVSFA